MTPEQKFFYDLKGWLLIPGVLMNSEIEVMKQEITAGAKHAYQGTLQNLLDHPCIVDILGEILAHPSYPNEEAYGFRCEQSFVSVRRPGWQEDEAFPAPLTGVPHVVAPPQQANAMRYQVAGSRIYSGLTRVVWELEEVKSGCGGTSFLSGSHKAHFNYGNPDPYRPNVGESSLEQSVVQAMEDYSCPPGSVVVFTESLLHASNAWTNSENARSAVFNCYNSLWSQWHRPEVEAELIQRMPLKRQSLFAGVWELGGNHD